MSGKNPRFRSAAVGLVVLLALAANPQAFAVQRGAPEMSLLERMIPASLRLWRPAQETSRRRALPVKCGGTIEPNGGPCPHPAGPAPWTHRRALPVKCGGTIDPNGGPCPPRTICASCG